jgi:hypothetical protein
MGASLAHLSQITDALCRLVASNTTLVHLDISHNNLSMAACVKFAEALKRNQTIMYGPVKGGGGGAPPPRSHSVSSPPPPPCCPTCKCK